MPRAESFRSRAELGGGIAHGVLLVAVVVGACGAPTPSPVPVEPSESVPSAAIGCVGLDEAGCRLVGLAISAWAGPDTSIVSILVEIAPSAASARTSTSSFFEPQ